VAQSGAGPHDWHPWWACPTQEGAHPSYGNGSTWLWASRAERRYSRRKEYRRIAAGGTRQEVASILFPGPGKPCLSFCDWRPFVFPWALGQPPSVGGGLLPAPDTA